MRKSKVFIPEVIYEESHESLKAVAEVKMGKGKYMEEELIKALEDVDAVLTTSRNRFTRKVLESTNKLKIITKYGSKPENIDIQAATERGIIVTWTPTTTEDSVAEHTVMFMLVLLKDLFFLMDRLKKGGWRERNTTEPYELLGRTVGIIGLGAIGFKVAEILTGFNVKLLVYDPYTSKDHIKQVGAKMVDLETLLRESDIVTIHAALTETTRGLIRENELKKMKKGAFIINTARGPMIDENALYKALKDKWIAGAALDVFEREPPSPDNPLLKLDNIILTPHIAAWTFESLKKQAVMGDEDVARFLRGQTPKHILNPEVLKS